MPLTTDTVSETGESNSTHVRDGIFVEQVTITGVDDLSGETLNWGETSFSNDLRVEFTIEGERDRPFDWTYSIGGDFNRPAGGGIEWGGAFVVARAIKTILGEDFSLTDENRVPSDVLRALVGETFLLVEYVTGEENENGFAVTRNWNQVVSQGPDEDLSIAKERAALIFEQEYQSSGYPRNYDPNAMQNESDDTSFEYGENATDGWETSDESVNPWDDEDDEDPGF